MTEGVPPKIGFWAGGRGGAPTNPGIVGTRNWASHRKVRLPYVVDDAVLESSNAMQRTPKDDCRSSIVDGVPDVVVQYFQSRGIPEKEYFPFLFEVKDFPPTLMIPG